MDYSKIVEELKKASLFDLYRLQVAIGHQLENPKRLQEIKKRIKVGQKIKYFDDRENRLIQAKVINFKRTRLLVENTDDGQRWNIPFYYVNIDDVDADLRSSNYQEGIDKSHLKIGDRVGFRDRQNNELYGEVIRLNQKTATIIVNKRARWRVAYSLLFPVIDSERVVEINLIEGEVFGRE